MGFLLERIENILVFASQQGIDINFGVEAFRDILILIKIAPTQNSLSYAAVAKNLKRYEEMKSEGVKDTDFLYSLNLSIIAEATFTPIQLKRYSHSNYSNTYFCPVCKTIVNSYSVHKENLCRVCKSKLLEKNIHVVIVRLSGQLFAEYIDTSHNNKKRSFFNLITNVSNREGGVNYYCERRDGFMVHRIGIISDTPDALDTFDKQVVRSDNFHRCPTIICENDYEYNIAYKYFDWAEKPAVVINIDSKYQYPYVRYGDKGVYSIHIADSCPEELIDSFVFERAFRSDYRDYDRM